jgi:hypothetical protein
MLPNVPLMGEEFNHVAISRANGHETCGNFPFVQTKNL